MELEAITSSLISHRGYDPATKTMQIRFKHKTLVNGALYEYANISPEMYGQGLQHISERTGELSFGQWFQLNVKADDKNHPFRKIEDPHGEVQGLPFVDALVQSLDRATDFTSQQPIPATTVIEAEPLPEDVEELKVRALALQEQAKAIIIRDAVSYAVAETTGVAIVRMRDALEKTLRPQIQEAYRPYKALLEILNYYDGPLEADQRRLTVGMTAFKRAEDARVAEESRKERQRLQDIADADARKKAEELKRADIQAAKDSGDKELARQIKAAPALPVTPAIVPPVHIPSAVAPSKSSYHVEAWEYEWVDARGQVIEQPDLSLIPGQYILVDTKAIAAAVKRTKARTAIPGVRPFDAGAVRLKKK